jgi:hypothetical protein
MRAMTEFIRLALLPIVWFGESAAFVVGQSFEWSLWAHNRASDQVYQFGHDLVWDRQQYVDDPTTYPFWRDPSKSCWDPTPNPDAVYCFPMVRPIQMPTKERVWMEMRWFLAMLVTASMCMAIDIAPIVSVVWWRKCVWPH